MLEFPSVAAFIKNSESSLQFHTN